MKTRARQGIIGVLVITTVTGFMVMYNNTSRAPSPSSSSQPGAGVILEEPPKRSTTDPITVLRGYKSFVDQKPLKMHCSSCSLVSSSGQLTGGRRGEEIDRAQCVIRMNDAPSAHFQRDVGRRTDLRVVAHSSLTRVLSRRQELLNASQDTVFIFWGPSSSMRRDGKGTMFNSLKLVKRLLPRHKLYVVSQRKMLSLDELFKNETGMDSFADDTKIQRKIDVSEDAEIVQEDLDNIIEWSKKNNMVLHQDKFMLLRYRTNKSTMLDELRFASHLSEYATPRGHILKPQKSARDLGVELSSDYKWTPHINKMLAGAIKTASWVLGVFKDRSKPVMLQLYKSLIRSRVEYCCPLWNPVKVSDIQTIEDVQRNFTRRIA
ncbi:alpha-N-acetylgalactosaminide alpha-2,6-sialyltransferase 5b isoform X1 [Gadus chalcogrammus]|uniref:alpha-N-acetylgalactosaminide alpha-2,6-sialyltransferase 5b isoform X1 n=1 Tax=Gadus chalcogrammus TaxID=1042646 RepID=UPI0024C47527|nr:alpha-N-acetylgalactosaminide alpha-2,6-sialyltransferase 5b isoform X1 [Gadus chalcogrammus]